MVRTDNKIAFQASVNFRLLAFTFILLYAAVMHFRYNFLMNKNIGQYGFFCSYSIRAEGKNLLLDLQRKLYVIKVRWQVKRDAKIFGVWRKEMGYRRTYRIHESGESKTDPDLNSNPNPIPKP